MRINPEKIRLLNARGKSDSQIAAILRCNPQTIGQKRRSLGLAANGPIRAKWSDAEVAQLATLIATGKSFAEIAKTMGRTPKAIAGARERFSLLPRHDKTEVTFAMRMRMVRLFARGLTFTQIGQKLGVAHTTVMRNVEGDRR